MLFACSRGAWALGDQGLLFFLHLRSLGSEFSCGFGFLASGLGFDGSMLNDLGCRGRFWICQGFQQYIVYGFM